jgi:hypothetical protein
MNSNPTIGPTGIKAEFGRIHIEGYPTAKRVCKIVSHKAKRLAHFRLHESDLQFCSDTMQILGGLGKPDSQDSIEHVKLREALLIAIISKFCGCFGNSKARASLNSDAIYRNIPYALDAFNFTKDFRNKHVIHDDNNYRISATCAILGEDNDLIDIISWRSQCYLDFDFYKNLFELINTAQKHVQHEIQKLLDHLFLEIRSLPITERAKLLDFHHSFPSPSDVSSSRTY